MFHQVQGVLVGKRHEVEILLLAELVFLVEHVIGHLAVFVEIPLDNAAVSSAESLYDFVVAEHCS